MRSFEMDFDFDFEEGVGCRRTKGFRGGDDYLALVIGGKQVFTLEREARVQAHCKRIQIGLKNQRKLRKG